MSGAGTPLGIIAAEGKVPLQVARAARSDGRSVHIVGLEGLADPGIADYPHITIKWGQLGRVHDFLTENGVKEVVLIGGISRRPDFKALGLDMFTVRLLPRILKNMSGGDDAVLRGMVAIFEDGGFRVLGAHEIDPQLTAEAGDITGRPARDDDQDIEVGVRAALALGRLDAGQAVVAQDKRVVALEGAEGTDAMIARVGSLKKSGRVRSGGRRGVLIKCSKPGQDLRIDMPTIGPGTVEAVRAAGLGGIVIEARRVMIAERDETERIARDAGVFIRAIDIAELAS